MFPALQRTLELKTLKTGSVNRARCVTRSVGGKATNAARVLKALGAESLLMSFTGGDTGTAVRHLLDKENIPHRFVETAVETRTCQTILADNAHDFTELIEEAGPLPARDWKALLKAFAEIESGFDHIIFSGTLPAHAPEDIYVELIAAADPSNVILDTSGAPLLAALEQRPALVKINAEELLKTRIQMHDHAAEFYIEIEEAAQELIAQGAGAVGITQGADSALLVTPNETLWFAIPQIEVKSTLGCGDSVNAGIAFSLCKGNSLIEAFVFGLACGAANAQTAMPGVVKPEQISELAQQIQIDK